MGKLIDETGNRYGKWVVIRRVENSRNYGAYWLCRCDCGTERAIQGGSLRRGASQSCRCLPEMKGQKFGRLMVIQREGTNKRGESTWFCECSCGNQVVVIGTKLRSGNTRSCGCLHKERMSESHKLPSGEAAFNRILNCIKRNAKSRGYKWQLTKEQVQTSIQQPCYYCGAEPNQGSNLSSICNGVYLYNGIDRVDNSKGYTFNNIVPCCGICNKAKNSQTVEQFKAWIHAVNERFLVRTST